MLPVQIANYEYGFFWYFYNDGHIEHEVKLTGCLSTNLLSPGEGPNPTHGTLLHPGLNAQVNHCTAMHASPPLLRSPLLSSVALVLLALATVPCGDLKLSYIHAIGHWKVCACRA